MMREDCLEVVNMIDNMNNRDLDIDIRDVKGLHENIEIWLFINMNKFPDKNEFMLIDSNNAFMSEYYSLAKRVYNIARDEEALMYEGLRINNAMLRDDGIKKGEIFRTLYAVIQWIGWFQEKKEIIFLIKMQVTKS